MLQTVPDPFDSYGPPQSEDQIFSILPPLSIMPTAPSSTASPTTRTPELDAIEGLPSSSSSTNWMHSNPNTVAFPSESSEWADAPSTPTSTSPTSSTPTSPTSRRHSAPSAPTHTSRKSDSKLRSVLSAIDETHPRNDAGQSSLHSSSLTGSTLNGSLIQPQPQKKPSFSWGNPFSYGHSPYDPADNDDNKTPRNSTFLPETPKSSSPTPIGNDDTISNGNTPVPITS